MMNHRFVFFIAAILAFLAVVVGAFGAHLLEELLIRNERLAVFETASQYHFYHALALLLIGVLVERKNCRVFSTLIVWLMVLGVCVFSGSLYLLAITDLAWLGAITPIGGSLLLLAWGLLAYSVIKTDSP